MGCRGYRGATEAGSIRGSSDTNQGSMSKRQTRQMVNKLSEKGKKQVEKEGEKEIEREGGSQTNLVL